MLLLLAWSGTLAAGQEEHAGTARPVAETEVQWEQIEHLVAIQQAANSRGSKAGSGAASPVPQPLNPAQLHQVRELAMAFLEMHPHDWRAPLLRRALLRDSWAHPADPFVEVVRTADRRAQRNAGGYWDWDSDSNIRNLLSGIEGSSGRSVSEQQVLNTFHAVRTRVAHAYSADGILDRYRTMNARLMRNPDPTMRRLVAGQARFLDLAQTPLALDGVSLAGGGVVDLEAFRGKVVLVDIWSLTCSSCVAAMPRLQTLYEKYRHRGFEIVGFCLVGSDDPAQQAHEMARAREVSHAQGATWTEAALVGMNQVKSFMDRYSLRGTPQLLLLDRGGQLATQILFDDLYGPRAGESRLELEIERLLDHPPGG